VVVLIRDRAASAALARPATAQAIDNAGTARTVPAFIQEKEWDMASMVWFKAIIAVIGVWFVGVSWLAASWRSDTAALAFLLVPASIVAALLVVYFIWRAAWRHDAADAAAAASPFAAADDGHDDLDDVLAQSFPASDPPSSTTGIARVLPVPAR